MSAYEIQTKNPRGSDNWDSDGIDDCNLFATEADALAAIGKWAWNMADYRVSEVLPGSVTARWDTADWDDENMVASKYTYEAFGVPIELTEEEASQYTWGQTEDNITGGSQRGDLR